MRRQGQNCHPQSHFSCLSCPRVRCVESICVLLQSELEAHSATTAAVQTLDRVTPAAGVGRRQQHTSPSCQSCQRDMTNVWLVKEEQEISIAQVFQHLVNQQAS